MKAKRKLRKPPQIKPHMKDGKPTPHMRKLVEDFDAKLRQQRMDRVVASFK